jgi:hypothetical protein
MVIAFGYVGTHRAQRRGVQHLSMWPSPLVRTSSALLPPCNTHFFTPLFFLCATSVKGQRFDPTLNKPVNIQGQSAWLVYLVGCVPCALMCVGCVCVGCVCVCVGCVCVCRLCVCVCRLCVSVVCVCVGCVCVCVGCVCVSVVCLAPL